MSTVSMRALLFIASWLVAALCAAQPVQPDYAREKRWADEITPAILVGDPVYLAQPAGHKFLAIYTPHDKARGGVIVVHGLGLHPDWGLNNVLRSRLAEQGYATLSLQMPVLAAEAKREQYAGLFADAAERLRAGVAFLRDKGQRRIAIVSHSMGARMTNHFLVATPSPGVEAWVALGILGEYVDPAAINMPVLDLYGEKDFPDVLTNAPKRAAALRTLRGSGQVQIAGADHFFNGANAEAELVKQVRQFLDARLK